MAEHGPPKLAPSDESVHNMRTAGKRTHMTGQEENRTSSGATRRALWLKRPHHCLVAALLFAVLFPLFLSGITRYGITYDEPVYIDASWRTRLWLKLLAQDPIKAISAEEIDAYWQKVSEHPGFFKLVTATAMVIAEHLGSVGWGVRAGTPFLAACGFAALYLFVANLWGTLAGLYAVGALLLMPRIYGHCHLSALDAPVMSLSLIAVAASWRACQVEDPTRSSTRWRAWLWPMVAGLCWGLAASTKLNGLFVPFIVFPWALLFGRQQIGRLAVGFALAGPLAFIGTWPWLWYQTGPRLMEYLRFHLQHRLVPVQYFGTIYTVAPWHYPLVMTAITVPVSTLALAAGGIGRLALALLHLRRGDETGNRSGDSVSFAALALALWALVVNIAPNCLPNSLKYNGERLFLPAFPWIAVLAAAGFHIAVHRVRSWLCQRLTLPGGEKILVALLLFIALAEPLNATATFLRFPLSYYNALIGGLPGAVRAGMEPTYWGDTYRAAAVWLETHAEPGATIWIEPAWYEVTVWHYEISTRRRDLRTTCGPENFPKADYVVTQNKPTEFTDITRRLIARAKPVFTDGVDGVPLVFVFKRQGAWP